MITEASVLLRDEIRRYLRLHNAVEDPKDVVLGNVAGLEDQPKLADKVILTLVNIEEESTLKNGRFYVKSTPAGGLESIAPPIYLNLYFLISATLPPEADDGLYQKALLRISSVIELFQAKKEFSAQNSPGLTSAGLDRALLNEVRLRPELYTLTFEQINHLWGALGGKQSPSVMYKVRLVRIQNLATQEAPPIETIQNDSRTMHSV
jgi:hypothetical protein